MYKFFKRLMSEWCEIEDWKLYYHIAYLVGLVTAKERDRLIFQKYTVITPEGNYYDPNKFRKRDLLQNNREAVRTILPR